MRLLFMLAGSLLAITQYSLAQDPNMTTITATAAKGYTVLNSKEPIIIYKYAHPAHSAKEADKYAPTYFFTTSASDALQPLTKMNLKKAYPNNHPFHDALDANFKEDKELNSYDDFHKMYKINWLLKNNP